MSQQYDFVAIGDILIDAFIQLNENQATVTKNEETGRKTLSMEFGSKLPYDDVVVVPAVGNSPNAATSATRLGLETGLVTHIGNDKFGKECLQALRDRGVHTDFVKVHEDLKTNYHYVLRYGPERTILINHEHYPYALPDFPVAPKFFYFSSVGEHGLPYHKEIAEYVKNNETKLAFQPGTFQIKVGVDAIREIYEASEIFFCNKEEAQEILKTNEQDIPTLVRMVRELGPTIPVVTDGPNGAFTVDADDQAWHMPMFPDPAAPVDRTGAGDAFSSTFTSAIILGKDPAEALSWGPINSMSVVQHIGAQEGLLPMEELQKHLDNRPDDYMPSKV